MRTTKGTFSTRRIKLLCVVARRSLGITSFGGLLTIAVQLACQQREICREIAFERLCAFYKFDLDALVDLWLANGIAIELGIFAWGIPPTERARTRTEIPRRPHEYCIPALPRDHWPLHGKLRARTRSPSYARKVVANRPRRPSPILRAAMNIAYALFIRAAESESL